MQKLGCAVFRHSFLTCFFPPKILKSGSLRFFFWGQSLFGQRNCNSNSTGIWIWTFLKNSENLKRKAVDVSSIQYFQRLYRMAELVYPITSVIDIVWKLFFCERCAHKDLTAHKSMGQTGVSAWHAHHRCTTYLNKFLHASSAYLPSITLEFLLQCVTFSTFQTYFLYTISTLRARNSYRVNVRNVLNVTR